MKKLIYILFAFLSITSYGQAIFDEGIQLSGNTATAASEKIISQQPGTGELNYIDALSLPLSNATTTALDLKKNATSTAITSTATLTNNGTTFSLSAFTGVIVDNSIVPAGRTVVNFAGASNVTPLYQRTLLYVNSSGTLVQQNGDTGDLTPLQKVENLFIGTLVYSGGLVLAPQLTPNIEYSVDNRLGTLSDFIGNINSGNIVAANGANLQINKGAGKTFRRGSNFAINRKVPDVTDDVAAIPVPAGINLIGYRNGVGGWTYEAFSGSITPQFWDDGSGVKATVANNKFTNPQVYFFNGTDTYVIYLGQAEYSTLDAAKIAVNVGVAADPATSLASLISTISVEKSCTALNNTSLAFFTQGPKISGGNSSSGTQGAQNMQSVYNNSSTPQITTSTTLGAVDIKRGSASDTDNVLTVQNGAGTNTFAVNGNGTTSSISMSRISRSDINFVFEGDSRTAVGTMSQKDYPDYLNDLNNFANQGNYYNVATGGASIATLSARYATDVYPKRPNGTTVKKSYLFLLIGINDVMVSLNPPADTIISDILAYINQAQTDGFNVVVMTTFYRQDTNRAQELARIKLNDALRYNSGSFYKLIDLEQLFPPSSVNNFYIDVVHLKEAGNSLIAQYINSQFNMFNENSTAAYRGTDRNTFTTSDKFKFQADTEINTAGKDGLIITDNSTQTTGVGGSILFKGNYVIGGNPLSFGRISMMKENSTDANYSFGLGFYTSNNGGSNPSSIPNAYLGGNGSFGIGTQTPSVSKLHIKHNSSNRSIRFEDDNGIYDFVNSGAGINHSFGLYDDTNGAYRLMLFPNGNLGINTFSDNATDKLQVNGSVSATNYTGSATLTGTPTAPTATAGTNTTQIATTAFVQANKNKLVGYTVATLPTGTIGDMAYVTDASGFTYNSIVVGGGSGITPVFFDGTNWRAK